MNPTIFREILRTAGGDGAKQPTPRPYQLRLYMVNLLRLDPCAGQPERYITISVVVWPASRWKAAFESQPDALPWTKNRIGPFVLAYCIRDGRELFDEVKARRSAGPQGKSAEPE